MTTTDFELRRQRICDFRYSLIAELGNPYLARGELTRLIKAKAEREYVIPYSSRTSLTAGCIRRWLNLYRKYGKTALMPREREDQGQSRSLSDSEQTALIKLLESNTRITAIAALRILREQGIIKRNVSSSSLSRFIKARGLTSRQRIAQKITEQNLHR